MEETPGNNINQPSGKGKRNIRINSSRNYLGNFVAQAAQSLPQGDLVLDAGAGDCPYKSFFPNAQYESADFCQVEGAKYGPITYVCDLSTIPVEDNRYDLVLCTQVLEHVTEPELVLKEFFRILKPGKELWISAPLFYAEHQIPFDYYRYTRYGLSYLIEKAGFQIKKVEWLEGYYGTLSYQMETAARALPITYKGYGHGILGFLGLLSACLLKPIFLFFSILYGWLDLNSKNTQIGLCKNYCVIAEKPPFDLNT
jgi:SAM-dependent methyltransferase